MVIYLKHDGTDHINQLSKCRFYNIFSYGGMLNVQFKHAIYDYELFAVVCWLA